MMLNKSCLHLLIAELSWTRLCFPWSAPGPISNPPEFLHWPWVHSPFQGFGSVSAEHWLGNEFVYMLTSQRQYALRVELTDWDGHQAFSQYDRFHIGSEKNKYRYWKSCDALIWCWFIQAEKMFLILNVNMTVYATAPGIALTFLLLIKSVYSHFILYTDILVDVAQNGTVEILESFKTSHHIECLKTSSLLVLSMHLSIQVQIQRTPLSMADIWAPPDFGANHSKCSNT